MPRIHLWCPSVRATQGGIEGYSAGLCDALRTAVGAGNLTVLIRNDRASGLPAILGDDVWTGSAGSWPAGVRRIGFAILVMLRALRERPDLIITTHLNFAPFASLIRRITGIPYWVVLHGVEAWHIQRESRRRAVAQAQLLLPVSALTRDRVAQKYKLPPEKMHLLPDTFDPGRFAIGPKPMPLLNRHGLAPDDPVILTVGRLAATERYKGHDRIIRALPVIRAKVSRAKYIVVGDGDDRPRLEALAREYHVSSCVIFAGRVADAELPEYYRLCDLFAMPSTGEGFGIVFLEALATGKAVLAGNRDGASDALHGGELGVLVDPDNEAALADTAAALLSRTYPHPLVNEPERLRQRVIELFGPERFRQRVAELLTAKMTT